MTQKKRKPKPGDTPPDAAQSSSRSLDRHKPYWMVRLTPRHKVGVKAYVEKHKAEHGIEVDDFAVVRAALEAYLKAAGLWPPPSPDASDE